MYMPLYIEILMLKFMLKAPERTCPDRSQLLSFPSTFCTP